MDFRTNLYYCLMGSKGQHKALRTSLAHKNSHLATFSVAFVYFTRLHSHMKTILIQFKFITIIKVNICWDNVQ